jgi:hypothetical protein
MQRARYIYEILKCLDRHEGQAELDPVIYREVFDALKADMTAHDLSDTNVGGEERWRNEIRQARRTMIDFGLLEPKVVTNVWEISKGGREYLRAYPNVRLWESSGARGISSFGVLNDDEFEA